MTATSGNPRREGRDDGGLSVGDVFARAIRATEGQTVSVEALSGRAPTLLFVIGVLMVSPIGAIPGAPLVCAGLVALLMGQSVLHRGPPWVPRRLAGVEIDAARLRRALERTQPWVRPLERLVRPRLTALIRPPLNHLWALACILIALTMLPLGFVPFGAAVPALALAIIGLGLMSADGVLVLAGVAVSGGAFWLGLATLDAAT